MTQWEDYKNFYPTMCWRMDCEKFAAQPGHDLPNSLWVRFNWPRSRVRNKAHTIAMGPGQGGSVASPRVLARPPELLIRSYYMMPDTMTCTVCMTAVMKLDEWSTFGN